KWIERFGQADKFRDLRRRRSLHHRLRVCESDVLGGEYAESACDEDGISAALDEPREPVERRVRVGVSQRLDERRGEVVVLLASFVISVARAAQGLDDRVLGDATRAFLIRLCSLDRG